MQNILTSSEKNKSIVFFDFACLNYGGGCELNFLNFGKWLTNKGYHVGFVTPSAKLNRQLSVLPMVSSYNENISDSDLENKFELKLYYKLNFVDLFFATKNRLHIVNVLKSADVIISKNEIFEVLLLKFFLQIPFEKVVFGFHTPIFYPVTKSFKSKVHNLIYNSGFYLRLLKKSKVRCLVLSEQDEKILMKHCSSNSIAVIPNPLNTQKFFQKKYIKHKHFKIYYIGRMTEQKGIDTLMDVIKSLSTKSLFASFEFHFFGAGELDFHVIDICNRFSNCFYYGFTTDVVSLYQEADLVIVPSRWESFCYTVAEAQSCGVPVVSTNVTGPKDIIINNQTGWLCEVDNVNDIETKILEAYLLWKEKNSVYIIMGLKARQNIVDRFAEDVINNKIEKYIFSF